MSKISKFFLFVGMLLSISSYAYACQPAPFVDITRPVNNFTTDQNTLAVTVAFGPYRCKHKHKMPGKIELIILKIDDIKVAAYNVPQKAKEGSKDFSINISSYTEAAHILRAFAYKDKKGKHQTARSEPVAFIIERGPTLPPVTPQSGFIHGTVYAANSRSLLGGVTVTVKDIPGAVTTNEQGTFTYPTPGTGNFSITYTKPGYILSQRKARVVTTRNTAVDDVQQFSVK